MLDQLDQHFSQGSGCEFRFIEAELDLVAGDSSIVTCLATNFGGRGGWLPIGQSRDCNSLKVTTYRTTSIYVYRSCADIRFYQLNHSFTKQQDWTITFPTHLQCLDWRKSYCHRSKLCWILPPKHGSMWGKWELGITSNLIGLMNNAVSWLQ